jgi:hypothetical protein
MVIANDEFGRLWNEVMVCFKHYPSQCLLRLTTTIKVFSFDKQPLGQESRKGFPYTKQEF